MKPFYNKLFPTFLLLVSLPFFLMYVAFSYTQHLLFERKTLPASLKSKILQLRPGDIIVYNDAATKITKRTEIGFSLHFDDLILSEDDGGFSLAREVATEYDPERIKPYTQRAWKIAERQGQVIITVE